MQASKGKKVRRPKSLHLSPRPGGSRCSPFRRTAMFSSYCYHEQGDAGWNPYAVCDRGVDKHTQRIPGGLSVQHHCNPCWGAEVTRLEGRAKL